MKSAKTIEVVGIYPVATAGACHLVELRPHNINRDFDFGDFTQEIPGTSGLDWQVPWLEQILSPDGTTVVADDCETARNPELLCGDVRCVFFFHYLDLTRPMISPFGMVSLPKPTAIPERLRGIRYERPC